MAPPTILAHKSAFLHAQTLQLALALAPSARWRARQDVSDAEARLSDKAVDDAVYKLNHRLQQHARRIYAPLATRNVAEQTDALFLGLAAGPGPDNADDDDDDDGPDGDELRRLGVDLCAY